MQFEQTIAALPVVHLGEIDSTNAYIKRCLSEGGAPRAFMVYADAQTQGRGRLGRTFVSPGGGLYLSVLLPAASAEEASTVTPLAAVSVCEALREKGVDAGIKWVNDIYVGGKKVCGILCEGVDGGVIIGIGVNIRTPEGGFPESAGPAGAIDRADVTRQYLLESIAQKLLHAMENRQQALDIYRRRSVLTGRQVVCAVGNDTISGTVLGIDDSFGLMIQTNEGDLMTMRSGEVTRVRASQGAAFFDFDGTMRKGDSIVSYVGDALKSGHMPKWHLIGVLFWVLMYLMKVVPKQRAKTSALRFWNKLSEEEKQKIDEAFALKIVNEVYPDALNKWRELKEKGYTMVLLSASTENYMQYVARELQADALLCTPIEADGKVIYNCHGKTKVERAEEYAGIAGISFENSCSFGDSIGDIHILTRVKDGFAVNPKPDLEKLAAEKGLGILHWQ